MDLNEEKMRYIFRGDTQCKEAMPMLNERLQILRYTGSILVEVG
jgi:hypothetical protein